MRDKLTHAYSEVERGNGGNGETSEVHPSSSISSTFCSNCGAKMNKSRKLIELDLCNRFFV